MTVDNVSAGELIDPEWGNAVADEINHRGIKAYAYASGTDQSGIGTSVTDMTGVSATWTATASRLYRCVLNVNVAKQTTDNVGVYMRNGAGGVLLLRSIYLESNYLTGVQLEYLLTGVSGSQTVKGSMSANSGTCQVVNSFSRNALIYVEDIGAA